MSIILETKSISKSFKGRTVVNGVDLVVNDGEIVGLLGPNGAGKTTTFNMCMGMVTPDSGHILLHDEDVTDMPIYQRARRGLGYLAQEASVFRKLSVADNILAVLETLSLNKTERQQKCDALLEEFGLTHLRDSMGEVLSGGERRRVEIARALATNPKLILLDEPFSGVDPIAVEDIQSILVQLQAKGIAILLTDHNVRETLSITNRSYILSSGTVLAEGTAEELVHNSAVRKVYLGENFELS
ncbi:MAG: LPS export ABC transporter ATP-binding protein [Planctomycetota bacterium]|nr:LPS export ABC transporter ATP-binding protein [Planctomycetota bacterium]